MEIGYENNQVEKLFRDYSLMIKEKGFDFTKQVKKRINQIEAAETFYVFLQTKLGNPHPLTENLKGLYSISINSNMRLIVKPEVENLDIESLKLCTKVIIKGVYDYHGTKTTIYIP